MGGESWKIILEKARLMICTYHTLQYLILVAQHQFMSPLQPQVWHIPTFWAQEAWKKEALDHITWLTSLLEWFLCGLEPLGITWDQVKYVVIVLNI